jgi:MFS family permease
VSPRHARRKALAWIALAQVGGMSTWFSAAAVAPALARDWRLSPTELALLTVAVQLGFVAGALTAAVTGLADVLTPRRVFVAAAVSELAEPERVGSALAFQAALGFLLTAISIQLLPLAQARIGWAGAFAILAVGPALGAAAMLRLRSRPAAARLAGGRR